MSEATARFIHVFDDQGPSATALASATPDPRLAARLDTVDLAELDDATLVEVVAGWRRLQSWAAGRAALAAAALAERASMNPGWPEVAGRVGEPCVAAEELAMRLGCSRRAAANLVQAGKAYDGVLWPTGEALLAGHLDETKARVLLRGLAGVAGVVALDVQEEVLPGAARRTPSQLEGDVQRALIRVDPDEAAQRAGTAAAGRRVCRPKVLADGMAGIWAVLPAPAAVALHQELSALAGAARRAGDPRTIDQLRADALCCAVLARGVAGSSPAGRGSAQAVAFTGAAGVPGSGKPSTPPPADSTASGVTQADPPDLLATLLAGPGLDCQVQVVVAMDALLGVGDGDAELRGYGAIAPATAEALARGGTWRRLVTDPLSGALLDVGRTRYRPPPDLAAHVRTRDGTCVRPGCPTSAARCEIDHNVPFGDLGHRRSAGEANVDLGGATAADNLGCLCKRDHLLKTHAGFQLRQVAPGVFEWITPAGHRYVEPRTVFGLVRPISARRSEDSTSRDGDTPLQVPGRLKEVRGPDGRITNSARVLVRPHFPRCGPQPGEPPPF